MSHSQQKSAAIRTEINYLAPGSFINRRFVAPAQEVNTGEYRPYSVTVNDGRPNRTDFTLDSHGFTLLNHRSAVKNFRDHTEVEAIYPTEVVEAIKTATGADRVAPLHFALRTSGDLTVLAREQKEDFVRRGGVQPPGAEVHVDTVPDRSDPRAHAVYQEHFPDAPPFRRYLYTSFWRTFSPPPQDCPLALCDGTTVGDDEGVPNTMFIVDKIPNREDMLRPMPDEDKAIAAAIFRHNPAHRWWYFSDMTRDEALLFKFHDSPRIKPWRVPHTAFYSKLPGAFARESIEFRTIAYFS
jgi:hypothetical protein